jgi:glycosyltransferase involved in cell wall biosynthesis
MKRRSGVVEWIQFGLATALYRTADAIVAVSEGARDDLANYYHLPIERIKTIYNPVMIDEIRRQADEQVSLPGSDTAIRLISVGSLSEQKDISTAIRALAHLRDTHDVELLLLGKGEQQEQLETLATELNVDNYVHFLGFVDNPFPYMRAADALVLSSKYEGFGHVIVEAIACGTPVVATDCPGGPSEIIDDGTYGQLVPVGDHEALSEAITATLANPMEERHLLERAQQFEYERITEAHIDLLL